MNIHEILKDSILEALQKGGFEYDGPIHLEHPDDMSHGDYSTNIAMVLAPKVKKNPRELAETIKEKILEVGPRYVEKVEVAGPGFINFYLSDEFFTESLGEVLETKEDFGKDTKLKGQRIMVEYTDPNPFKVFHIGHLMSNAIGESISRMYEYAGANVVRACYQGDVGLHVAKAMWGILRARDTFPTENESLAQKTAYLGTAYVAGAQAYEQDETAKQEINQLNKIIFEKSDDEVNNFYARGRAWSLEHFEEIYKKLGTSFAYYFFESEVAEEGMTVVKEQLEKGVFKESDGAIVFEGETYGLHTRVFINSMGLPTYEAKEIGLTAWKEKREPNLDTSIIITAEEQKEYMKVVQKAVQQFWPGVAEKTKHITHGMMQFQTGKMSSRTGNVITGESLLSDLENLAKTKIQSGEREIFNTESLASIIAVAGIKYSILKQSTIKNIIFDPEQSLSFEGDSGPYLQYTFARTQSILEKAHVLGLVPEVMSETETTTLERFLYRFPETIDVALGDYAPHHIANYLIELAREFNSFYGNTKIIDEENSQTPHNLAITLAVGVIIKNGLWILGIQAPEKM